MEKLKRYFAGLSGAVKFMFILCILFTVVSILLTAILLVKSEDAKAIIDSSQVLSEQSDFVYMLFPNDLLSSIKQVMRLCITLIFNIVGYYISYVVGKFFGFFKSMAEIWADIENDGRIYYVLVFYNLLSLFFDISTICSFVII